MIEFTRTLTMGKPPVSETIAINPDKVTMISRSGSGTWIMFDGDSGIRAAECYEETLSEFTVAQEESAR